MNSNKYPSQTYYWGSEALIWYVFESKRLQNRPKATSLRCAKLLLVQLGAFSKQSR